MTKTLAGFAFAIALAVPSVSTLSHAATTVTFSELTSAGDGPVGNGMVLLSGGLTFTSSVVDDLSHWGMANPFNADPGGAARLKLDDVLPLTITRTGGGVFDLMSLQLAESESAPGGPAVDFSYTNGGGTFLGVLTVTVVSGKQTFVIGQPGITSFTLGGADFQLDDVIYNPVPEPVTSLLMASGLLALWGYARRGTRPLG